MTDTSVKKVVIVDLENKISETKSFTDLNPYFGGTGVGLKLLEIYHDKNPLIFSVGPLNGFFPFASKTSVVLDNNGAIEDIYIGGNLSTRIRFAGIDSILFHGRSADETIIELQNTDVLFHAKDTDIQSLGLPGKRSHMYINKDKLQADGYFTTPDLYLENALLDRNIVGLSITGTETYTVDNFEDYKKLYENIMEMSDDLRVIKEGYPSCSNCPMGCNRSKVGEIGGNVVINSLVACQFADRIYTDIGMVFSCLNTLGFNYTHEDIENLPKLIEETIKKISEL